jgi:hypothetical protein
MGQGRHTPRHNYTGASPSGSTRHCRKDGLGLGRTNSHRLPRPVWRTGMTASPQLEGTCRWMSRHPWVGGHQDGRQYCRLAAHIHGGLWRNSPRTYWRGQSEVHFSACKYLEHSDVRDGPSTRLGLTWHVFNVRFEVDDSRDTAGGQRQQEQSAPGHPRPCSHAVGVLRQREE